MWNFRDEKEAWVIQFDAKRNRDNRDVTGGAFTILSLAPFTRATRRLTVDPIYIFAFNSTSAAPLLCKKLLRAQNRFERSRILNKFS